MVADIKDNARMLDEKKLKEFITWLRDHTGQEIVQEAKLDGHLAEWLQAFVPNSAMLAEYQLILSEITWFYDKQKTEKVKHED